MQGKSREIGVRKFDVSGVEEHSVDKEPFSEGYQTGDPVEDDFSDTLSVIKGLSARFETEKTYWMRVHRSSRTEAI